MTEDIRLYSLRFELMAIAHRVKSSAWEIYYNKAGTFEAHIAIDKYIAPIMFDTAFIIAVEGDRQAFCTAVQINTELVLYGRTLNWLLSKRTVMPFNTNRDGITNNPAALCNKLVTDVFINDREVTDAYGNTVTIRGVHNMTVTDNSADFTASADKFYRTAAHPLSEVIIDRLALDGLGHRLVFDTVGRVWRFEIYAGAERPIMLSRGNRNFYDEDFTADIADAAGAGWYEPTAETDTAETADGSVGTDTEGETEEKDREYVFISSERYNADNDAYRAICEWDELLTGSAPSEAASNLAGKVKTEEITGTAARLEYGRDYSLGDVLRVQLDNDGFKRTFRRRVTGVKLYRECNEQTVEPVLEEV